MHATMMAAAMMRIPKNGVVDKMARCRECGKELMMFIDQISDGSDRGSKIITTYACFCGKVFGFDYETQFLYEIKRHVDNPHDMLRVIRTKNEELGLEYYKKHNTQPTSKTKMGLKVIKNEE